MGYLGSYFQKFQFIVLGPVECNISWQKHVPEETYSPHGYQEAKKERQEGAIVPVSFSSTGDPLT
jgi:hypothetical protein